jgi:dipeptidyl aminopeptidase/acylaminoacyl peptidase
MKETKISTVNTFHEKLVGIETKPPVKKEKYPAVILVHGFGVTKEEYGLFDDIAKTLSEEGILVFRFDFSGCGESEGDYSETSLSKLKQDLSKILEFVKSQPDVDTSKIGILGQSFGTSVIVALQPKVKTIILMGSVARPGEILGSPLKWKKLDYEGISERIRSSGQVTRVGPQFWKDFDNYSLLKSIKGIHCPILFIHGEKDDRVPLYEMEAFFENANRPKEKRIIKGANHSLNPCREEVYKIVVDWFKEHLV